MSASSLRLFLVASGAAALVACGSTTPSDPPDSGLPGGDAPDAGELVALPDASSPAPDGGPDDAGTPDAGGGEVPDAGVEETPDAGRGDAPDAGGGGPGSIRFVAIGDQGKANATQLAVGVAMKQVCEARGGCDFGILLGDNFYDTGVGAPDDGLFQTMFVQPYSALGFPFHPVLGNHDYGGGGAGYEFYKGQHQIEYSALNPQWVMPAEHYTYTKGPVDMFALDTTAVFWGDAFAEEQKEALVTRLAAATQPWKVAYGHHPYKSNGRHGNAGDYEGLSFLPVVNGAAIKSFVEGQLCGKVDVYLCGHDHNLQDLGRHCGTEFLVSGAAASTTELQGDNFVHFEFDDPGFLLVEATATTMTFTFFDQAATQLHSRTISK